MRVVAHTRLQLVAHGSGIAANVPVQRAYGSSFFGNEIGSSGIRVPDTNGNQANGDAVKDADGLHSAADSIIYTVVKAEARQEKSPRQQKTSERNHFDAGDHDQGQRKRRELVGPQRHRFNSLRQSQLAIQG